MKNPFLTELCLGKNTLHRAMRGLAPTKADRVRCDKREYSCLFRPVRD